MRVLVVNAGSSTLKLRVVGKNDAIDAAVDVDPWNGEDPTPAMRSLLDRTGGVDACAHRFVHGGSDLVAPVVVDDRVREQVAGLEPLAPLHQARGLTALDAARRVATYVPHVACFDTAFHATMPAASYTYALPLGWRHRWNLRRFGFHGLSHAWAAHRAVELASRAPAPPRRVVTCHLGAGASLCAVLDGRSVDTTMGYTPLDGLVMATRCGSVDPGLVLWLLTGGGLTVDEIDEGLQHRSGLAGLSGMSGDMRELLDARARGDASADLAFDVYVHRLVASIAAMAATLGGIDALAFTGGVGEHAAPVREAAAARLAFLGVAIDPDANASAGVDTDITAAGAAAACLVVAAREELEITRETRQLLGADR
jgi:acetate kinase